MKYSYTAFSTFEKCEAKFDYRYNQRLKIQQAPNEKRDRGTNVHDTIEAYLKGEVQEIPEQYKSFYGQFFLALQAIPEKAVEEEFAVTREWNPTAWKADDCFLRGKFDLRVYDTTLYEWKTGKIYDEHDQQRKMYGTVFLSTHPEVEKVNVISVYLDKQEMIERTYYRADVPLYQQHFVMTAEVIEETKIWTPRPQFLCVYCEFSRHNGGPCKF